MRIVLYEWSCSGGLYGPAAGLVSDGGERDSGAAIVAEGRAMLAALVADGLRAGDLALTVLVDASLPPLMPRCGTAGVPAGVRVIAVPPGGEEACLRDAGRAADWTVLVAPETAGVLAARVALVRASGGRVVAADERFIATAADKQATVRALAAAGVPVPAGRLLEPGASWPAGFALPAVVKAAAGCGGDGLWVIESPGDLPASREPRRLEARVAGTAVGVSCLCGPAGITPLPAVRQHFGIGSSPRFLGGDLRLPSAVASRSMALGHRAVAALARVTGPAAGWVGVDMILGDRHDGVDDRVLEVNPRLTTSFVGLSTLGSRSLLRALVAAAAGDPPDWPGPRRGDGSFTAVPTVDPVPDALPD